MAQQGMLHSYPDSRIENASVAILAGPSTSGGGIIHCEGTVFHNNRTGVIFNRYDYNGTAYIGGVPVLRHHPNRSYFLDCLFDNDEDYGFTESLNAHAVLSQVDGIRFEGCVFRNSVPIVKPGSSLAPLCSGIRSMGSGFYVEPGTLSARYDAEFSGFNNAIHIQGIAKSYPLHITDVRFEKSFTGIAGAYCHGIVVDGCTFTMNDGIPTTRSGAQLSIHLSSGIIGPVIQHNSFSRTTGGRDALGIVVYNLGAYDNVINRNAFHGMTIGNEAIGTNADQQPDPVSGLRYVCNTNTGSTSYDFYAKNPYGVPFHVVGPFQSIFTNVSGQVFHRSAGNTFSYIGSMGGNHDFLNEGRAINYYYHQSAGPLRYEPLFYSGLFTHIVPTGTCPDFPVKAIGSPTGLATRTAEFYSARSAYQAKMAEVGMTSNPAIRAEKAREASYYKGVKDRAGADILAYLWSDLSMQPDSVRTWLLRLDHLEADITAAGLTATAGLTSLAQTMIDAAKVKYGVTTEQNLEMDRIKHIYGMAGYTDPALLTTGDKAVLHSYAPSYSPAGAVARALLLAHEEAYPLDYFLPGGAIESREETEEKATVGIAVWPNPARDVLMVHIPSGEGHDALRLELADLLGRPVQSHRLTPGENLVPVSSHVTPGVYIYTISGRGGSISAGKVVILK